MNGTLRGGIFFLNEIFHICFVLEGHDEWVRTIAVSDDGKLLASGSHDKVLFFFFSLLYLMPFSFHM
jgi:WD40 repeat protein